MRNFIYYMKSLFAICLKLPADSEHQIFVSLLSTSFSHEGDSFDISMGYMEFFGGESVLSIIVTFI